MDSDSVRECNSCEGKKTPVHEFSPEASRYSNNFRDVRRRIGQQLLSLTRGEFAGRVVPLSLGCLNLKN